MLCRLAFFTLLGLVSACDAPPRVRDPVPRKVQEKPAAPALSKRQVAEMAEQCARLSREQFRRAWKEGKENTADGPVTAEFLNHYNAKLNTCFYLLTVVSPGTLKKMLFDINGGELYGEYLGPANTESPAASRPKTCRIENLYCASGREWDVLAEPYMQE
jgi:hypothetical protein